MKILAALLLCAVAGPMLASDTKTAPRDTIIKLSCANVSEKDALTMLAHYCKDFKIAENGSDYSLILAKDESDKLPYLYTVMDSVDGDIVEVSKRSQLTGAIKDACSAMHIRFGEGPK